MRVLIMVMSLVFLGQTGVMAKSDDWIVREKSPKGNRSAFVLYKDGKVKKDKKSATKGNTALVVAEPEIDWSVRTYYLKGQGMVTSATDDTGLLRWLHIHENDSYNVWLYSGENNRFDTVVNTKLGLVHKKFYGGDQDRHKKEHKNRKGKGHNEDSNNGEILQASVTWLYNSKPKKSVQLFNENSNPTVSIREITGSTDYQVQERFYDVDGRYLRQEYRTATIEEIETFNRYIADTSY